jgi:hypothetical protein
LSSLAGDSVASGFRRGPLSRSIGWVRCFATAAVIHAACRDLASWVNKIDANANQMLKL